MTLSNRHRPEAPGAQRCNGRFAFTGLSGGRLRARGRSARVRTDAGPRIALARPEPPQDVALQLGSLTEIIVVTDGPSAPRPGSGRRIDYMPPPSACAQTPVGGCIEQPMKLRDVRPIYPPQYAGGTDVALKLDARIGVDGFINDLRVVTPAIRSSRPRRWKASGSGSSRRPGWTASRSK